MSFTTLQWNIGGGKIRSAETEEYNLEGLQYIIDNISKLNPDIIFLQETHQKDSYIQASVIAQELSYPFWLNDVYDQSHIEKGQGLGQAILSRFPISNHSFHFFNNPMLETVSDKGEVWTTHNKGISRALVDLPSGLVLEAATLHLVPFRKFNVDPTTGTFDSLRKNIEELISPSDIKYFLLQGDFNFDNQSLSTFLPTLFAEGVNEVLQAKPTTPKGRRYDHILYKKITHIKSDVIDSVLTDHFPIISQFTM